MQTTITNTNVTMTIGQGRSREGILQPQVEVQLPKGTYYRALNAALLKLAADVEFATPQREGWIVQTERLSDVRGRVYLELLDATPDENVRGMALLMAVVTRLAQADFLLDAP